MIMGNQRQMLKESIEKELVLKIEAANDVLGQLNRNLETSKQNSRNVQEEINVTADLVREILNHRRKELMKQVENLFLAQIQPLQDAVKSTYVTMGRLQSILTNLDSFDQSQLVNLEIPNVDTSYAQSEPAQINAELDILAVKDEVSKWGTVTGDTDDFQCFMMEDLANNFNQTIRTESAKTADLSSGNHRSDTLSSRSNKENQEPNNKPTNINIQDHPLSDWGIENWLKSRPRCNRMSLTSNDENDEFLIVPTSCSYEDIEFMSNPEEKSADKSFDVRDGGESGSSIMCIGKNCSNLQSQEDLSMWLKAKKIKCAFSGFSTNQDVPKPACEDGKMAVTDIENLIPPTPLTRPCVNVLNSDKRKCVLEFPCLSMDAECWIRKKMSRPGASTEVNKLVCPFLNEQKKLMPSTYALPNPFWLKKFQLR